MSTDWPTCPTHLDSFEEFEAVSGKIKLLTCSVRRMKPDGMSNVECFVFRVDTDSVP